MRRIIVGTIELTMPYLPTVAVVIGAQEIPRIEDLTDEHLDILAINTHDIVNRMIQELRNDLAAQIKKRSKLSNEEN